MGDSLGGLKALGVSFSCGDPEMSYKCGLWRKACIFFSLFTLNQLNSPTLTEHFFILGASWSPLVILGKGEHLRNVLILSE